MHKASTSIRRQHAIKVENVPRDIGLLSAVGRQDCVGRTTLLYRMAALLRGMRPQWERIQHLSPLLAEADGVISFSPAIARCVGTDLAWMYC